MKDHEETPKLSLHSQPFKQGSGPDHGERMLAVKFTVCMNPSTNTVNSIFTLPLKKEKLSHATDCNVVAKAKLPLCFIFLFIVDKIKLKIKVALQYSIKGKKNFDLALSYFLG